MSWLTEVKMALKKQKLQLIVKACTSKVTPNSDRGMFAVTCCQLYFEPNNVKYILNQVRNKKKVTFMSKPITGNSSTY